MLVYAHGRDHPLRARCRSILEAAASGEVHEVQTTVEVIREVVHHRARTRDRADAVRLARALAEGLAPLIVVSEQDLDDGLRLFGEVASLGAFDCVLAAAARNRGAGALVSADRGFADVPGIVHVDPAGPKAMDRLRTL